MRPTRCEVLRHSPHRRRKIPAPFKAAPEYHGGPRLFLTPAVQISIAIAARTAEVLGYLRVAKVHFGYSPSPPGCLMHWKSFPTLSPGRTNRDFGRSDR
jgi:hypothetical protein